ncbi:hypothetical protein [Metabacillus fastidiosus]|uniref:hypothetical protein n=1 Tax=Metabacillus fastidiosus TaxID=1458 RepID=UPI002E210B1D|nr:hypothetical protein [Metabacillus fastidiosus]
MGIHYDYSYLDYQKQEAANQFSNKLLPRKSYYQMGDRDADQAQSKWGMDFLLLRLVQKGELEEDPRTVDSLIKIWEGFHKEYSNIDFTLDELITNGWIRVVWDRWYLPQEFTYSRKIDSDNPLVIFLQRLNQVPYSDERKLRLYSIEVELDLHRRYYPETPDLNWLLSEAVILKKEKSLFLNCSHRFVNQYASFILAKLWEQETNGPLDYMNRLTWWKNYFEYFMTDLCFFENINNYSQNNFLEAAVERLLTEKDCLSWQDEKVKLSAEGLSMYPDKMTVLPDCSYYYQLISERELDKMNWITSIGHLEAGIVMDRPREMLNILFSLVLQFDNREKLHLKKLINNRKNRPYFYKILSGDRYSHYAIPYLLLEEDATLIGIHALIHYTADSNGLWNERERSVQEAKAREIWDEGLSFLAYTLHTQPVGNVVNFILELVEWFYREIRKPTIDSSQIHHRRTGQLNSFFQLLLEMPRHSRTSDLFIEDLLPELINKLEVIYNNSDCSLKEELWPFGLWLIEQNYKGHLQDKYHLLKQFSGKMVKYYIHSFSNQIPCDCWINVIEKEIESLSWLLISKEVYNTNKELWQSFLCPIDFQSLVNFSEKKYSEERKESIGKIRSHIKLLSYLTLHLKNEDMLKDITSILSKLLLDFQHDKPKDRHMDVFDPHFEYNFFSANNKTSLFDKVSLAINNFADPLRINTLRELKRVPININRLSMLYNAMSREKDKKAIIQSITPSLVDKSLEAIMMLPDIQNTVREMLNTGNETMTKMAIDIMERYTDLARERNLLDWIEWEFSERLRANFILGNGEKILNSNIPKKFENRKSIKDTLSFYQGLVLLNSEEENQIKQSITIFENLINNKPGSTSCKINLIAANVRLLERLAKVEDKNNDEIQDLTNKLSKLFEESQAEISLTDDQHGAFILTENHLYMLILIDDYIAFLNIYSSLDTEMKTNLKIGSYAVQVYIEQQEWEQANLLLHDMLNKHGHNDMLLQLQEKIKQRKSVKTFIEPSSVLHQFDWKVIGSARNSLKGLTIYDQARAYFNKADAKVRDVLVTELFQACNKLKSMVPTLLKYSENGKVKQGEEDHYNDLLAILLNQSIKSLGWTASTQPRGGFTGNQVSTKGGIGERDIVIYDGNNREITIIEGLRLQSAVEKNILSHFQKLFRYDASDTHFYFLINWGFYDDPVTLWSKYEKIILSWSEGQYSVVEKGNIFDLFPFFEDHWPLSFYTKHFSDIGNEIYVIHLYVDVKMKSKWKVD